MYHISLASSFNAAKLHETAWQFSARKTVDEAMFCSLGPLETFSRGDFEEACFPIPDIRLKRSIFIDPETAQRDFWDLYEQLLNDKGFPDTF